MSSTPAATPTAAEIESAALKAEASHRQAQNAKAHQVRRTAYARRDPALKKIFVQHDEVAKQLVASEQVINDLTLKLGAAEKSAADLGASVTALEADKAALLLADSAKTSQITALEADKAATAAELAETRKQLKAALSKKAPAAGDAPPAAGS